MNDIETLNKSNCCACGACLNICPKNAIYMANDIHGFVYPKIRQEICVDCGLCVKACNYNSTEKKKSLKETYAAATADTNPLKSASGGLFASLAKHFLLDGGIVYGCAMIRESEHLIPKHIRVTDESDLVLLQGSKYVQSEIGLIYQTVKSDLKDGKTVLFSGTPCQVDGLKGYLGKEYNKLYTIDIICHGVPNVKMFNDYIRFEERKRKGKIIDYRFRDKSDGWRLHGKMVLQHENITTEDILFEPEQSSFYQLFLNSYTYRENCYSCPYACDNRPGDITIGDYWCIDLVHPEMLVQNGGPFDEQKGISCLIINCLRGRELFDLYGSGIERKESSFNNVSKYNGQLTRPSELKPEREYVLSKYLKGYDEVERWYKRRLIPIKMKRKIRAAIPKVIKRAFRKIIM